MRNERGNLVLIAMVALVLTAAMVALLLERTSAVEGTTRADTERIRAWHAAEGGLEQARAELRRDPQWKRDRYDIGGVQVTVFVQDDEIVAIANPGSVSRSRTLRGGARLPDR
ncbi:MAG: hypothetical protein AAGD14_03850 [Planctomycetota bacterium]